MSEGTWVEGEGWFEGLVFESAKHLGATGDTGEGAAETTEGADEGAEKGEPTAKATRGEEGGSPEEEGVRAGKAGNARSGGNPVAEAAVKGKKELGTTSRPGRTPEAPRRKRTELRGRPRTLTEKGRPKGRPGTLERARQKRQRAPMRAPNDNRRTSLPLKPQPTARSRSSFLNDKSYTEAAAKGRGTRGPRWTEENRVMPCGLYKQACRSAT